MNKEREAPWWLCNECAEKRGLELKKENAILRELVNKARSLIEIDNVFGVGVEWTNFRHWANEVDQALEKVKSERAEAE